MSPSFSARPWSSSAAARGIGLETARRARAEGADVILDRAQRRARARRRARGRGARHGGVRRHRRRPPSARFFQGLPKPVDHVMVTAGRPDYGRLADMDHEELRRGLGRTTSCWRSRSARNAPGSVEPGGTLVFMGGTGGRRPGLGMTIMTHGHGRPARAHRQPGAGARADPRQPDRRRLRRHAPVGVAARRPARRAPRPVARHSAYRSRRRARTTSRPSPCTS